ncbi:thioredoxin domain-containing protein 2-like isoform X2 [Hibiscus syriacus]|uniref:thioredoxin domain-containing protein 2-like isoform X2 n=1 Tax=Hibiscus syriacus TaxID=106335 RepID=UPI001921AA79|nr:thioredoxin domain-containing protein 2-like isoform X2 [Hibiscus syriacus]
MRTAEEDSLADLNSIKMKEGNHIADESKNDKSTVAETDISKAEEVVNSDTKLEQSTQEKKKESDFKLNELSDSSHVDEKAVETLKDHKKDSKDDAGSAREVLSVDGVVSSENRRETDVPHSSQKAAEEESADVPHSSQKATEEELTDVLHSSQKATEEESTDVLHSSQKATEEESTDVPHSSQKATEEESTDVPHSSQKATEDESTDVSHSTRAPRSKRKESVRKETTSSVDGVSKKAYEATSDSEKKTNRRARKKVSTVVSNEDNAPDGVDETKKENDTANDSEAKSLKKSSKKVDSSSNNADETMKEGDIGSDSEVKSLKSSKKVDSSGNNADESISRQLTDSKRRARGKVVPEKDRAKTSTENDEEEVVGSQDSHMEETPKANSKRKHTLSKEKASDSMEYGENLVGLKVKVWWPADREFYVGFIHSFDPSKKKHKVNYIDGDQEILNLKREKWVVIEDESGSDEASNLIYRPQRKKAKTPDLLSKKTKTDASPKSGGGTSTGKSKGAAMKSGRKTKDEAKMDGKSKDGSKSASKSDNDSVAKSKDHTPKTGSKSFDIASKASNKSKNEDSGDTPKSTKSKDDRSATPKASTKLKQDALKTAKSKQETSNVSPLSKGKPPRSGGKSNDKGTVKSKSDSSKVKESESTKEKSTDSGKLVGSAKRKASSLSKAHGSDSKSGKKGRR